MASSEYEARSMELQQQYMLSGDLTFMLMLDELAGLYVSPSFVDPSMVVADDDRLSDEAVAILAEELSFGDQLRIVDLNAHARALEAHCDANYDDAMVAAEAAARVNNKYYRARLGRYDAMFEWLSAEDRDVIRDINLSEFGIKYPVITSALREIYTILAAEFPDEYLSNYRSQCQDILAKRGLPFRKVTRSRTWESGSHSSHNEIVTFTQEPDDEVFDAAQEAFLESRGTIQVVPGELPKEEQ